MPDLGFDQVRQGHCTKPAVLLPASMACMCPHRALMHSLWSHTARAILWAVSQLDCMEACICWEAFVVL